jgi:putative endonuclease
MKRELTIASSPNIELDNQDRKTWIKSLKVGDIVCDCRYRHVKIISYTVSGSGDKTLNFKDFSCSARHCCSPADHWHIYIVKCKDNTLYTGIAKDLGKRIEQHDKGTGARYTKGRGPVVLVKVFTRATKSEALKLEYKIKQLSKEEKLNFND